jgi:hypothetical protein
MLRKASWIEEVASGHLLYELVKRELSCSAKMRGLTRNSPDMREALPTDRRYSGIRQQ